MHGVSCHGLHQNTRWECQTTFRCQHHVWKKLTITMLEDQKSGCNLSYEYYWNNKIKLKALSFYLWVNELFKLLFLVKQTALHLLLKETMKNVILQDPR